ncbi:MAG: hypothetical protein JWP03_2009, partial [Phycisphaerales bacterium]|nr:hypothetical protein [Phycisphaerales bacterium]
PATRSHLERPWQVELKLPDGKIKTYWCNPRLWNLYGGHSVGPNVLQCALMAVEAFLLEFGKKDSFNLEEWLTYLLRETNNVAVVAVVASVAMAYPVRAGRAAVSLLTNKDLIRMDFARSIQEMHSPVLSFPMQGALEKILVNERKASHKLPHRRNSLEILALQLQMGPLRPDVAAILDAYKEALPPIEEQNEDDKLWRIALHRMDIRVFRPQEAPPPSATKAADSPEQPPADNRVMFAPGPLEPDLQEIVDEAVPGQDRFVSITALFLWGEKAFRNEPGSGDDWQEKLILAKVPATADDVRWPGDTWAFEGPIFVAAVCVRDHWADLNPKDREWCTEKLLAAVKEDADASDFATRMSGAAFDSASRAALVLPLILSDGVDAATEDRILKALVTACTHPNDKVAISAASGIGRHLGKTHPHIVQGFVGLFSRQAKRLAELGAIEVKRPYTERRPHEVIQQEVRAEIRLVEHWTIPCTPGELASVPTKGWLASQAYKAIMAMLLPCPTEPLALRAFQQVAAMLSAMWRDERDDRGHRDYHFESDCEDYLAHFARKLPIEQALQVIDPVLTNIDKSPKEVASFVKDLVIAEDNAETTGSFWPLWSELASRILKAPWLSDLEQRYPRDEGLLREMFLGLKWNEGVTHWHCLEGHSQLIDDFFEKLPAVAVVFSGFLKFLYDIGERSLPNAFLLLERKLRAGTASKILSDSNVVFYLETILRRYVYGKPDALKQHHSLRNAVLYLLDQLIDAGSSTAYRMRDDFVTPGSSPAP